MVFRRSGEDVFDYVAMYIGEAEIAALKTVGEALVVNAEKVQDGGLQVVNVDFAGGDVEGEVVGLAVAISAFYATAGEEKRIGIREVIAAEVLTASAARFGVSTVGNTVAAPLALKLTYSGTPTALKRFRKAVISGSALVQSPLR